MASTRAAVRGLCELHPRAHARWVELDPLPPGQQRSRAEEEWDEALKQLSPKINIINVWADMLQPEVFQMEASQLGKMPTQEAQAALDNIYELTYMLDTIDEVEHQLEPDSNSFPACRSRPLALLVPPAVLRLRGYTPYTVQMRLNLIDSTAEMALVAATGIAAIWLPTVGAKVVAVGAAAATLLRLAATTRQLWVKDDVPQRRRDIKQLEDSLREARSMAEDGGIVAGLAGAMAGKLKATLQRAEEALSAIERQPAAQQQPQQPPHQAPPGAAAMPPPSAHGMSLAGAAAAAEVPPGAVPAAAGAVPPAAVDAPDFDRMSVGDLKQFIASRGAKLEGAIETADLVAIAKALHRLSYWA